MGARVLLVAWKGSSATSWVGALTAGGYTVLLEDTTGERAWRTAKERGIDVVIIDGQKKPSHGRQTGYALRDTAKTRSIPIIWTNLDQEDVTSVENEVHPDVTLTAPTDAGAALDALKTLGERVHWANGALFDAAEMGEAPPSVPLKNGHAPARLEATLLQVSVTVKETVAVAPAPREPLAVVAPRKAAPKAMKGKKSSPKRTAAKSARPTKPAKGRAPARKTSTRRSATAKRR